MKCILCVKCYYKVLRRDIYIKDTVLGWVFIIYFGNIYIYIGYCVCYVIIKCK